MKQVESQDKKIDYGYSDSMNKKINVNAKVGVDSFFDSLYTTFGIKGNEYSIQLSQDLKTLPQILLHC